MKKLKGEIQEIGIGEATYPQSLRSLDGAPDRLFTVGNVALLSQTDSPRLCLFGARRCSDETKQIAADFTEMAIRSNCVIVNGGAVGVDTAVLWEVVNQEAKAVVFLGSITDMYPQANATLFQKIVDLGGVVVSHNSSYGLPQFFRERMTHMMAYSDVAFVISAGIPSGTVSTAYDALEMGKPVWAYPGSDGCNDLIRDGASLVGAPHHFYEELQKL